jgi:hypothetical protein
LTREFSFILQTKPNRGNKIFEPDISVNSADKDKSLKSGPVNTSRLSLHDLAREDWNFDFVPDPQLVACCFWEYARESAFIRETLQCYRQKWQRPNGELFDEMRKLWDDVEKIRSIGYAAEVFVSGCTFEPGKRRQSLHPDKPGYRHPKAPPLTGSFPAPWQSLSEYERRFRAHIRSDVEQLQIAPIKLSDWCWAKEIARQGQHIVDCQHDLRKKWEKEYVHRDEKGNFRTLPGAPEPHQFAKVQPRTRWGVGETLMVDIAWDFFTDDQIVNYFRKWVKHVRPDESPMPNGQGRNKVRDWRVALERLAMMRLLNRASLRELPIKYPKAWALYGKREWYKERKRAREMFHRIFPFLSEEECPLSWPTKGGRSK